MNTKPNSFVICAGLRRSASTWLYQVASEITRLHRDNSEALGFLTWQEVDKLGGYEGKRYVLKTHSRSKGGRELAARGSAIVLMTYRDPRAIVASMMKMWNKSFDDIVKKELGSIEREYRAWSPLAVPTRTLFSYEMVIHNPHDVIVSIAWALGWPMNPTDENVREIYLKYCLEANKMRGQDMRNKGMTRAEDKTLWANHIHETNYREILTPEQINRMDIRWGKWITDMGYKTFKER